MLIMACMMRNQNSYGVVQVFCTTHLPKKSLLPRENHLPAPYMCIAAQFMRMENNLIE